jgi:hypothetical protein
MELTLNLAWAMLALWMICLWLRFLPQTPAQRRVQFAALALLIFILLPVISITDDLLAAQNPAEVETCLRRDLECSSPHSIVPVAAIPLPVFAGVSLGILPIAAPGDLLAPTLDHPALTSIENRPPPAA